MNRKEIKNIIREEARQQMGMNLTPTQGPEMLRGEKVLAEVYQDSITESQGNTSIEETACIIAAIVKKEPNNTNISREEIGNL